MKNLLERLSEQKTIFKAMMELPDFKKNAFDLMVASLMINILSLVLPLVILQLFDRIIPNKGTASLFWLMIGCGVAIILESLLRQVRTLISSWWGARLEYIASNDAITTILDSRLPKFEESELGVHLDRVNSISSLCSIFAGSVLQVVLDLPFAFIFIWCLWFLGGYMVLIPLTTICIYVLIMILCRGGFARARKAQIISDEKRNSFYIETFSGIPTIKSIGMEEVTLRRAESLHAESSIAENRLHFWDKAPGVAGAVLSQVALFGVILFGAKMLIEGNLTLGILSASTMMVRRAMGPFVQIAGAWLQLSNAKLSLKKVKEISEMEADYTSSMPMLPNDIDGAIQLNDISYRENENKPFLLENINLFIGQKEFISITSTNAKESTSLLSIILGTLQPTNGEVLLDNYILSKWNLSNFQGGIEYISSQGTLFAGTILDNITMFDTTKQTVAMNAASLLELDKQVAQLPAGFQTKVTSLSNELFPSSLIQRISLARNLVDRPKILILDRINESMDNETEQLFEWLINHLKGHITIILVTNDIKYLSMSDAVYKIDNGTLKKTYIKKDVKKKKELKKDEVSTLPPKGAEVPVAK